MVQIFALVESLLPDETKQSLQYILEANPYTLRAMEVKSNYIINWTSSVERREYSLELIKDTDYNNDPEYTKTEICLRKFIDENFGFDDGQKQHFIDSYQKGMVEYISSTKNAITLFALVYLIYPVKKLTGKGATDHVEKGKHLCRGIMWKDEPENSGEVLDMLSRYFPQLKKWGYAGESTKTPSKSINYLVKEVRNGNRWIESFIEDYWPNDPMTDFKEKLKGALK